MIFVEKDDNEHTGLSLNLMAVLATAYTFSNTSFAFLNYNMVAKTSKIQTLQLEENQKYKYMFDALEDPILLIRGGKIEFSNVPCSRVFPSNDLMNSECFFKFSVG